MSGNQNLNDLTGRWVSCSWNFGVAHNGRPHPDDVSLVPKEWRGGCVTQCLGVDADYLVLSAGAAAIRIKPFSAVALPHGPKYSPGERVRARKDSERSAYEAPVRDLVWHFKNATYVYYLAGKSTRYFEAELESPDGLSTVFGGRPNGP